MISNENFKIGEIINGKYPIMDFSSRFDSLINFLFDPNTAAWIEFFLSSLKRRLLVHYVITQWNYGKDPHETFWKPS